MVTGSSMASKTKSLQSDQVEPTQNPNNLSLQATVVSVFTKFIGNDTKITYAMLKTEKETLYAAWRNSYFARDIMVHRKYTFSGAVTQTPKATYLTDPTFIDVPIINKYFDLTLAPPSQEKRTSHAKKIAFTLVGFAVLAGFLTIAFNSSYVEQQLANRNIVGTVIE